MKRIRQTIEVAEPLWRALELMSRDMGVDRDALVAQALFQLARQNGYVSPTVVSLGGVAGPVAAAVPPVNPGAGAQELVSAAAVVADSAAPAVPAAAALSVGAFSADDATEEPATEPPGVTPVPLSVAQVSSTELVLARMQEILAEVEDSVQPSEGLAAQSDDSDDEEADDSDAEESAEDSDDSESEEAADDANDEAEAPASSGVKGDVSSDDIAAELAALGIVEEPEEAAQAEAPVATPIAARPLVARPVPKLRPPDEAATILEDQSAETTNIVKAPTPLEVFVRWAQGTPVSVSTERFTIGRGPRCSLVVKSERVSREHAVVTRVGDEVFIEDLNSSNGTWFNNERITRQQVSDGDEYMLGTEAVSFTMRPVGS
ncbi:FHA domain-containing protein [Myxococcus sp. SDU36]|uniref:FHA domain-containing protein n=1 Tax=Myxococcus sp. SDU36 TaxID=2831967 RepID=UPI0025430ED7|nr:FHA domain-containing protein [Myxococcus sp. SDU36]WIG95971.1 FHA domain-containing protein [Myxococcus sp. SDU36]